MDVVLWRKAERERLLALRQALAPERRAAQTAAIAAQLDRLLPEGSKLILGAYWPIRAEPDLRDWLRGRAAGGLRIALPVAVALGQPLTYREWQPGAPLTRGLWQIPYPAEGAEVVPDIALAPLVGFDPASFRLGYGGGFFDRTLAGLRPKPHVIGVGYAACAIPSIHPQPHDIPMDLILTGG